MSYRDLKSYQQATIIYDFTVEFCKKYVKPFNQSDMTDKSYRTADQMEQAARSGKQNIVEGSTERTSKKSELYLLGVARASFQELLEDFEDFLRQRSLAQWGKDDPRALEVRNLYKSLPAQAGNQSDWSDKSNKSDWSDKSNLPNLPNQPYQSNKSDWSDKSNKSDWSDKSNKSDPTYQSNKSDWSNKSYMTDKSYWSYLTDPESAANCAICLANQVNFLLDHQIKSLEKKFVDSGGYSENLRRLREEEKKRRVRKWLQNRRN